MDLCACCAPHVDTTGQIGLIKVVNVQSHRGGVRINILCGNRALADYTEKQDSVWAISSLLSAKQPEVAGAVARAKEDARLQKERANALQAALRNAVNTLTGKYSGYCGIFAGDDTNGYRFIVGSASCNCQELADRMRRELSAKGGGSAPMIQGNVAVTADTLQTIRFGKSDYFSSVAAFFFSATLTAFATPPPTTQLIGISSAPLIPQNATANINRFAPVAFMLGRYSV